MVKANIVSYANLLPPVSGQLIIKQPAESFSDTAQE